jgi:hypothetical protein
MRVQIVVVTDDGNTFYGDAELSGRNKSKPVSAVHKPKREAPARVTSQLNLSSPIRPFMKRYARNLGGAQKFTLLLAHLTKGDTKKEIGVAAIQKQWGKMKGILGEWNPAHATRAKDLEAVDSPKHGVYSLLPGWRDAINA